MGQLEEGQCPGCGTTWVGHSGFGPVSGNFPSKNAMSCPVHAAAPKFLAALKNIQLEASEADESDNPYNVLESIDKLARDAIQEAQK
ncbi:hypothetical protein LCGC14_2703860 [marine sediment metagenome]|uniref:Uncharacterized protein n=1 Tax=marine sediment metagenome TaxID=412755 RepID=A0A0F9A2I9_9ZZZZ